MFTYSRSHRLSDRDRTGSKCRTNDPTVERASRSTGDPNRCCECQRIDGPVSIRIAAITNAASRNPATGPASEMRIWLPRRAIAIVARRQSAEAVERDPRMAAVKPLHRWRGPISWTRIDTNTTATQISVFSGSAGPPPNAQQQRHDPKERMDAHGNAEQPEMQVGLGRWWFAEKHRLRLRIAGKIEPGQSSLGHCGLNIIQSAIRNPQSEIATLGRCRERHPACGVGERIVRPQRRSVPRVQHIQHVIGRPARGAAVADALLQLRQLGDPGGPLRRVGRAIRSRGRPPAAICPRT